MGPQDARSAEEGCEEVTLERRLASGEPQYGLWLGLGNPYAAEICTGAGADWVLIDGQHAPNSPSTIAGQLHALKGIPLEVVARTPGPDPAVIGQYLDLGVRNLVIPGVDSPDRAREVVAATRYPPSGTRAVASTLTRATDFGRRPEYLRTVHDELCIFVQIQSKEALDSLPEIVAVPGVDGIFVSPADIAASMGRLGNPRDPDVRRTMSQALDIAQRAGVYSGLYASSPADGLAWTVEGASLVAIGSDVGVLQRGTRRLFQEVKGSSVPARW